MNKCCSDATVRECLLEISFRTKRNKNGVIKNGTGRDNKRDQRTTVIFL